MGTDCSTCSGVLTSTPYPSSLAERTLRRQIPKVGAQCVNHARWDLCGGCSAMGIPTAIRSYDGKRERDLRSDQRVAYWIGPSIGDSDRCCFNIGRGQSCL